MVRWRAPNKTGAGEAKGAWGNSPALDQLRFLVALLVIVGRVPWRGVTSSA